MSNKLVSINKSYDQDINFWEENPQLAIMKPFSELYNRDKTKNKKTSSLEMYCIFFINDADEQYNKFYRIPLKERIEMLKDSFFKELNVEETVFKKCSESYTMLCLDSIERTVKEHKDLLIKRSNALSNMEYTLDTMKDLDSALAKSEKIYSDFKRVEAMFDASKKEVMARGGRALTASEKKLV
jgi:hypothetical protein